MDTYTELKSLAEDAGTNLTNVCLEAKVNRSVIERWKTVEPKSFQTLRALKEAIQTIKANKAKN